MSKNHRKTVGIIALCLTAIIALSSCAKPAASPTPTPTPSPTASASTPTPTPTPSAPAVTFENAPVVVTAIRGSNQYSVPYEEILGKQKVDINDNEYVRYIFEKTGVRIKTMSIPGTDTEIAEKLAVELAGGTQIDVIQFVNLRQEWMESGTIIKLNDLFDQNPDMVKNIRNNINDPLGWKMTMKVNDIWGVPIRNDLGAPAVRMMWYRSDWLKNLSLNEPDTMDDLTEMLRAFTFDDPDGNGVNDTWGMTAGQGFGGNTYLTNLFNVNTWYEVWDGDRLIPAGHSDKYRYALQTIGTWFQNGSVDLEGLADAENGRQKLLNGKIGFTFNYTFENFVGMMKIMDENNVEAEWDFLRKAPISAYDGKRHGTVVYNNAMGATMITSRCKQDNLTNVLKLFDWMASPEGTEFLDLGFEGREHKVVNGQKVKDTSFTDTYLYAYTYVKSYVHNYSASAFVDTYEGKYRPMAEKYLDILNNNFDDIHNIIVDIKYDYPLAPAHTDYPDWRKTIGDHFGIFVMGEKDVNDDEVWAAYIKESEQYGSQILMDQCLELYRADGRTDQDEKK